MGKSTPQAPTAPDPTQVANAQQQYNVQAAQKQQQMNMVNQQTAQGSLTYQQTGTNPDGTPQYTAVQSYSPQEQAVFNAQNQAQQGVYGIANQAIGSYNYQPYNTSGLGSIQYGAQGGPINTSYNTGGPVQASLDFSNLSQLPQAGDFAKLSQQANDAVYNQATSRLDPQWQLQQQQLASTLAAKGVTEGSAAYQSAMDQFQRQKTDAYNQATYSGIQAGEAYQGQLFGQALQSRQQGAAETEAQGQFANTAQQQQYNQNQALAAFGNTAEGQQFGQNTQNAQLNNQAQQQAVNQYNTAYSAPMQTIAQLLQTGGGVQNPNYVNTPTESVGAAPYAQMVENQYNDQYQQYLQKLQNQQAGLGSIFGTLGSLGGAVLSKAPIFSDRRLKHNIIRVGELGNGIPTYVFSYLGSTRREFGVMADEVLKVMPEAVANDNGFMTVDYRMVCDG